MKINKLRWSTAWLFSVRVVRWVVVILVGVLLWLVGLGFLGVSPDLPQWRHIAGAASLAAAFFLWQQAR